MNNISNEENIFPYLLDTSAILSFIEDEEGADRVEEALKKSTTLLPWPVLLETYYITLQEEGPAEADRRIALLKQLKVIVLWNMDEATLLTAARLKAEYRVSLADAIIAAFAIRNGAVLIIKTRNLTLWPGCYRWKRCLSRTLTIKQRKERMSELLTSIISIRV